MTCSQCGAELPASATFCHTCGKQVSQATFSYLPPGTPPWPTTVPVLPTHKSDASELSKLDEDAAWKKAAKPRPSRRNLLLLLAVLILTPLIGVAITLGNLAANGQFPVNKAQTTVRPPTPVPTTAAQPTPTSVSTATTPAAQGNQLPTPTSFQTVSSVTSSALGIVMKYPAGWVEVAPSPPTTSGLLFAEFYPQQQLGINVTVNRIPTKSFSSATTTAQINVAYLANFKTNKGVNNFNPVAATSAQRSLGGTQWDEQDATFTNDNNVPFHLTVVTVKHNLYFFSLNYYVPSSTYDEAMQKYIQPMFDSFQFQL